MRAISLVIGATLGLVTSVALLPSSALAEIEITAAFKDFAGENSDMFQKNGDASVQGESLRLTRPVGTLYGTAFYKNLISLPSDRSFSSYFTFTLTKPGCGTGGGADGLTFIVQTDSSSVGSMGGGLGYAGILPSIAVEFDTFKNTEYSDPSANHIGISLDGNPESVATVEAPFSLIDGRMYHAWVEYDGTKGVLEVRFSDTDSRPSRPILSHKVDLKTVIGSEVFVGFTAATGSCHEQHDVNSFYFHADQVGGGIDTSLDQYLTAAGN